jgi:UDP-N-acetylmuramoyl-tripeptide--D-alanyl-D-alanine ligase
VSEVTVDGGGGGSRFRWLLPDGAIDVHLALHGVYNVSNFLAAATCAWKLGVQPEEIAAAAVTVRPETGRGTVQRTVTGAVVIDDRYNSNPSALTAALASASRLEGQRHWAVLGDMLELGPTAAELHRECGRAAARAGFSPIVGVGPLARGLVEAAEAEGAAVLWFESAAGAAENLPPVEEGDVVLVKGSRGVGLERVAERLVAGGGD